MPFPWEVQVNEDGSVSSTADNPLAQQAAQNQAELAAVGAIDAQIAQAAGVEVAGPSMFPPGLAPQGPGAGIDPAGLPDYLTNPSAYVTPPGAPQGLLPDGQVPEAGLRLDQEPQSPHLRAALGDQLNLSAAVAEPEVEESLELAAHTKIKCPKCDTVQSASNKKCTNCGHDMADARKAKFAKLNASTETHQAVIYNTQGLNLAVAGEDGLLWKVVCKTGTLALSPGPGQMDIEQPLVIDNELFNEMVLSAEEKAFPYITIPETHANGALENTGYVRAWETLSRDELLADARLPQKHHDLVAQDPEDTLYLLAGMEFTEPDVKGKAERGTIPDTSIGVKFNFRNKRSGKTYKVAWEHVALTPMPWIDGLPAFGLSSEGPVDADDATVPFDGVYLGIQARVTADGNRYDWDIENIDPAQVRADVLAAIGVVDSDSKLELPMGVCIQRYDDYWVVSNDYDKIAGIRQDQIEAVDLAMSTLRAKYEAERERRSNNGGDRPMEVGSGKQLPPWPDDANYSVPNGTGLDLAIYFDPKAHPRDWKGRFKDILAQLKPNQSAILPGGASVTKMDTHDTVPWFRVTNASGQAASEVSTNDGALKAIEDHADIPTPAAVAERTPGAHPIGVRVKVTQKLSDGGVATSTGIWEGHGPDSLGRDAVRLRLDDNSTREFVSKLNDLTTERTDALKDYNATHAPVMDNATEKQLTDTFGRIQVDDSNPEHVGFSLPGGDDEYNEYGIERASQSGHVVTSAKPNEFVLTEYPLDAYNDNTDDYEPELLTHHALGTTDMGEAIKKSHAILQDRIGSGGNTQAADSSVPNITQLDQWLNDHGEPIDVYGNDESFLNKVHQLAGGDENKADAIMTAWEQSWDNGQTKDVGTGVFQKGAKVRHTDDGSTPGTVIGIKGDQMLVDFPSQHMSPGGYMIVPITRDVVVVPDPTNHYHTLANVGAVEGKTPEGFKLKKTTDVPDAYDIKRAVNVSAVHAPDGTHLGYVGKVDYSGERVMSGNIQVGTTGAGKRWAAFTQTGKRVAASSSWNATRRGDALRMLGRYHPTHGKDAPKRRANLSQDTTADERRDLSQRADPASLPADREQETSQTGDTENMPRTQRTVEQLLASQQADMEASAQRIADLENQNLQLSGQLSATSQQLNQDAISKRVRKLQEAGYPPVLCLAVKRVMSADKSRLELAGRQPDEDGHLEGGLNLSISHEVAAADGEGTTLETKTLQTPTDVAEYLLSQMVPDTENAAALLASVSDDIADLHLAQRDNANDDDAKRAEIDKLERERHPERFDSDGKRL